MNDPHENLPDELLEDLLQPLRSVEPPIEARLANRDSIRQALAARMRPAWWQRTVAVPLPVAIAASIILLLTAVTLILPSATGDTVEKSPPLAATQQTNHATPETNSVAGDSTTPAWSIQRSFIRTLTSSTSSEFVASNALENRDDS
jgi:hypothetical protein